MQTNLIITLIVFLALFIARNTLVMMIRLEFAIQHFNLNTYLPNYWQMMFNPIYIFNPKAYKKQYWINHTVFKKSKCKKT